MNELKMLGFAEFDKANDVVGDQTRCVGGNVRFGGSGSHILAYAYLECSIAERLSPFACRSRCDFFSDKFS